MNRNACSVEYYALNEHGESRKIGEANLIVAVVVSYGDKTVQVSLDTERETWEIEVIGKAVVYT